MTVLYSHDANVCPIHQFNQEEKKGECLDTALIYIKCCGVSNDNGCVKFKFDIIYPLYTKSGFEEDTASDIL